MAAVPATPWSLPVRAVDRQFPCSPAGIAQVLVSVLSSVSHQVSEWGWKGILLTLHLPAVRCRPHKPRGVLPSARLGYILPQSCQELLFHRTQPFVPSPFCLETNYFQPFLFTRKHFEMCRLLTCLFFLPIFSFQCVSVSSPAFNMGPGVLVKHHPLPVKAK